LNYRRVKILIGSIDYIIVFVEIKIKIEDKFLKSIDNIPKRKNIIKAIVINDMIEIGLRNTKDIKK
jgi:hypothetical protein